MIHCFFSPPTYLFSLLFLNAVLGRKAYRRVSGGIVNTGKNNRFPFLDILGYLKNTHKNPKFGRVRQVPTRELGWEWVFFKYPKMSKNGNLLLFPVVVVSKQLRICYLVSKQLKKH